MRRFSYECAIVFALGSAASARAQTIRIRVTDDIDEAPIAQALVTSLNDRALWRTDDQGILWAHVKHVGPNVLTIRRVGFQAVTTTLEVSEHDTLKVHVVMTHAARVLDTVSVSARSIEQQLSAFDRRRTSSVGGRFITLADIERRNPMETLDLFYNVLGVRVMKPKDSNAFLDAVRGGRLHEDPCPLRIGLDGVIFGTDFDVNDISPRDLYGIEVYAGAATIPIEYLSSMPGGSCGLVMLWTFAGAQQSTKQP